MKFTKNHTPAEILADKNRRALLQILFPREFLDLLGKEYWEIPLKIAEAEIKMPWGVPFLAELLIESANLADRILEKELYRFIPLWNPESELPVPKPSGDREGVLLFTPNQQTPKKQQVVKPAVIIVPGGGYTTVAHIQEGFSVAEEMQKAGYVPFILNYRVSPHHYPEMQLDLMLAIRYLRANAQAYGINAGHILCIGFSAGGHLCASTAKLSPILEDTLDSELCKVNPSLYGQLRNLSSRPDALCLAYPVISFLQDALEECYQALTGGDETKRKLLSAEDSVPFDYPKTFLWACKDDDLVSPSNALRMAEALSNAHIPNQMYLYPSGGHGCALAQNTPAAPWLRQMLQFMS